MPLPHQTWDGVARKVNGLVETIFRPDCDNGLLDDPYNRLAFKNPLAWYNARAPSVWFTWLVAGLFTLIACIQYGQRVQEYRSHIVGSNIRWSVRLRTLISAFIDTNDPWFVVSKFTAQSFWFLGGMQLDYEIAFVGMMVVFCLESVLDSLRVVIAYQESASLEDYVPTSDYYIKPKNSKAIELQPVDVYEDLSRPYMIVVMVFVTQALLIGMVIVDFYHTTTFTSMDGTAGVPVVGTMGSYVFYILGIFLALVFLLGPKTNYGTSEQNMSFWLQMLLTAKQTGACASWKSPTSKKIKHYSLAHNDWRLWLRFVMNFVINGIGFHVLIHALPIQVCSQGSFTLVVLRSVGMMYLVDLDDTAGCVLTLFEGEGTTPVETPSAITDAEVKAIRKVIDDATVKLDALLARKKVK